MLWGYRASRDIPGIRSGNLAGLIDRVFARDAAGSPSLVIMRRLHLALFVAILGLGCVPANAVNQASINGVVSDSAGVPQIGAAVQLLRPDMSVIATVYTTSKGRFSFGKGSA